MIEAKYLAHMGDDLMVVNAARVSFDKASNWAVEYEVQDGDEPIEQVRKLSDRDKKLISYLAREGHWTPFAHPQISLHIKAPLFVRTQCFKHKVGFTENEISRRYVDADPEFYLPGDWRSRAEDKKQGSGEVLHDMTSRRCQVMAAKLYDAAFEVYTALLKEGVAPEQARMVLPQAMLTEWHWTGSLAAWARFYRQRTHEGAQAETAALARQVGAIIAPLLPVSWAALQAHLNISEKAVEKINEA